MYHKSELKSRGSSKFAHPEQCYGLKNRSLIWLIFSPAIGSVVTEACVVSHGLRHDETPKTMTCGGQYLFEAQKRTFERAERMRNEPQTARKDHAWHDWTRPGRDRCWHWVACLSLRIESKRVISSACESPFLEPAKHWSQPKNWMLPVLGYHMTTHVMIQHHPVLKSWY